MPLHASITKESVRIVGILCGRPGIIQDKARLIPDLTSAARFRYFGDMKAPFQVGLAGVRDRKGQACCLRGKISPRLLNEDIRSQRTEILDRFLNG